MEIVLLFPIFLITSISILTALILEYIQKLNVDFFSFYVLFGLVLVFGLNVLKFVLWNFLHKRYDLSSTYPLTAIYFPLIYVISVVKKEIVVDIYSLIAIVFIFLGVFLIFSTKKEHHK